MSQEIIELVGIFLALVTLVVVGISPILAALQDDVQQESPTDCRDSA